MVVNQIWFEKSSGLPQTQFWSDHQLFSQKSVYANNSESKHTVPISIQEVRDN